MDSVAFVAHGLLETVAALSLGPETTSLGLVNRIHLSRDSRGYSLSVGFCSLLAAGTEQKNVSNVIRTASYAEAGYVARTEPHMEFSDPARRQNRTIITQRELLFHSQSPHSRLRTIHARESRHPLYAEPE